MLASFKKCSVVCSPIADAFIGPTAPSYGTPGPSPGRYFSGGGGGGAGGTSPSASGGAGGSGIVVIRYKFQN